MKYAYVKGETDVITNIFIQDSSQTDGSGLTGLAYNTSGLTCYYVRPGAAAAALTLATQTVTGAHADGGFVEIDSTNLPGWYRLDLSDAILASGVDSVGIGLKGAANMAPCNLEIQLTNVDLNDSVRGGMTALPNAAAEAAGGLYTRGTGAGQINQDANGRIDVNIEALDTNTTASENIKFQYDGTTGVSGDSFPARQDQISGFGFVGGTLNQVAESFTLTTGNQDANTYTATHAEDGTRHQLSDTAGTFDAYYQFDISATGAPSGLTIIGALIGSNDFMTVYAYNWGATAWDVVRSYDGAVSSSNVNRTAILLSSHVGTDANAGLVRIRFAGTGLTTAVLYIDQLYVTYGIVQSVVGYANGCVWIDTINGSPGTVVNVNGVADNKCDSLEDALTVSGLTNLTCLAVSQGSTLTFTTSLQYFRFLGIDYIIDLNGQTLEDIVIEGAVVTGTALGGTGSILFESCKFGNVTLPEVAIIDGAFAGTVTASTAGEYVLERCFSVVAGTGSPAFDFGVGVGDVNLSMRHYSGGIEILNMGATGTDRMSLEGWGQLKINASCVSGVVAIRGHFTITDNAGGVLTVSGDARYDIQQIRDAMKLAPTAGSPDVDSIDRNLNDVLTDTADIQPKIGTPATGTVSGDIAQVKSETADILTDTNETQTKLPTNNMMGSSVKTDKDDEIDAIKAKTDNLPETYQKGVAYSNFHFLMVDSTDDKTPIAGLTVTGSIAQDNAVSFTGLTNSVIEIGNGYYRVDLTASEMNADTISLLFSATGANTRAITIATNS